MFYKEAYLIVKIKSSKKNNKLKAAYVYTYIFFPNFFFQTLSLVDLIDDKFHYSIVD